MKGAEEKKILKGTKSAVTPLHLIYTTNGERGEERVSRKGGGDGERGGEEKRRGRKLLIDYSWACLV